MEITPSIRKYINLRDISRQIYNFVDLVCFFTTKIDDARLNCISKIDSLKRYACLYYNIYYISNLL